MRGQKCSKCPRENCGCGINNRRPQQIATGRSRRSFKAKQPRRGPELLFSWAFWSIRLQIGAVIYKSVRINLQGLFVPGSVTTPIGQDSSPASIAPRSLPQNASSCARRRAMCVKKSSSPKEAGFHFNIITASQQTAFAVLGSVIYTPKMNNPLRGLGHLFARYRAIKSTHRRKASSVLPLWLAGTRPRSSLRGE
jgi:hypothetical protein